MPTRVFVYEHLCGGGLLGEAEGGGAEALFAEGAAMRSALVADLAAMGGVLPVVQSDARRARRAPALPDEAVERAVATAKEAAQSFDREAAAADWTVVIAPETHGVLLRLCRRVAEVGGRLLGPSLEFIATASNKAATARRLRAAGVPTPRSTVLTEEELPEEDFPFPAVLKPVDGAGSLGLRLVSSRNELPGILADRAGGALLLEAYHRGVDASVALLCGPGGPFVLPPCRQRISRDGRLRYQGGSTPMEARLAAAAESLGRAAVAAMPGACGYVGVDLVLSEKGDAPGVVVEINPRLTTSYVGLRAHVSGNLAEALLAAAEGRPVALRAADNAVEFDAHGAHCRPAR